MDPEDLSGSDDDWGACANNGYAQPASDDEEGDPDEVAEAEAEEDEEEEEEVDDDEESVEPTAAAAADDDDDDMPAEEEEEEDDDDDDEVDPAPAKPAPKNTLHQFLKAKPKAPTPASAASTSQAKPKASAPAPKPPAPAPKGKAPAAKQNKPKPKAAAPGKPKAAVQPAQTYTPHSDSEDEGLALSVPKNQGYPLPAPDPVAEFEQQRAAAARAEPSGSAAPAEPAPSVHESVLEFVYFMKNEKVNKFWAVDPEAFVSAPDLDGVDLLRFSMEDLTVASKRDRVAMQEALCDREGTKVVSTTAIAELKTDGSGSATGPGMSPIMMAVPYEPDFGEAELEDLRAKLEKAKPGRAERKIVGLLALDPELAKRAYAINKCPLPAVYNPNTNSSNKYKVPSKLEDLAKVDDNFTYIGPVEKPKRAAKRGGGEERPNGAKRPAAENGREEVDARHQASVAHAEFSGREIGLQNCKAWSLTCDEDDMYSLFQTTPGKWVLFRGKF